MFTRSMFQTVDMAEQGDRRNAVAALVDAGKVRSTVTQTVTPINAENLREAHRQLEGLGVIGKIVLEGWK